MKILIFLASLLLGSLCQIYGQQMIYVSPTGNDNNDGSKERPLFSLNCALEKGCADMSRTDTLSILIQSGDYYLDRPVQIKTSLKRPVVFRGIGEQKSCLLGGICINGWEPFGDKLYRAYVPEVVRYGFTFEQLYINGRRATLARTPNEDWYTVKDASETSFVNGVRAADYAVQRVVLNTQDISSLKGLTADEASRVKFRFYHKWDITQKHIEYADADSGFVYLAGKGMQDWNPITAGSRYVMFNYMKALDEPGEWYLDHQTGYIYYMPLANEDMATVFCVAPALQHLLVVEGTEDAPVRDLHFENISFQYSSYLLPDNGEDAVQAAAFTDAALLLNYAEGISFVNCELMHLGSYGIWLKRGCHRNKIEHCYLADFGAGGIKIGEPFFRPDGQSVTSGNIVDNCVLQHMGSELPCGVGIALFHASDNRITHNDIADLRYSGISSGWFWGYNQTSDSWTSVLNKRGEGQYYQAPLTSPSVRNIIEYNHVHHIGWGELSDMGAIYTLGESPGTSVSNNVIHDILSYDYGGWGLYTDEGSRGITMRNNLVYRCKSGGFHQHYGRDNKIENNIFAFGFYYQAQFTRVEKHLSFSFRHNIILQKQGETLSGPWKEGNIDMGSNLYWSVDGTLSFDGLPWEQWKKEKENDSMVASPLFIDAENDDFRFKTLKNVRKIGFIPFDYSQAGVYGSKEWKEKAQLSSDILREFKYKASIRLNK